jgi:hypothetical protein
LTPSLLSLLLLLGSSGRGSVIFDHVAHLAESSLDPGVLECLHRSQPLFRLPLQTLINEVHEVTLVFVSLEQNVELLRVHLVDFALGVWLLNLLVVVVEENFAARRNNDHGAGRWALHAHDQLHLLFLVLTSEERHSDVHLEEDTTK